MRRDTVVFLGPTLPVAEARKVLDAEYLPPAAMGDVYKALRGRPRRIAIIDGYFERMAAPWHKEILWALENGVAVYGAASMGALRAAELDVFGMVGAGQIYADLKSGKLTDDDEVAVLHGPADRGYVAMSEAMVNVRAAVSLAERDGVLSAEAAERLVGLAKQQFYRDRSWESVIAAGKKAGLDGMDRLASMKRPDAKADDARTLLQLLAARAPEKASTVKLARTWFWWRFVDVMEE